MSRLFLGACAVALACLAPTSLNAQASIQVMEGGCDHATHAIDVRVNGVRSDHGYVTFALYGDNPDDFLVKGKKIFQHRFTAKRGTVSFCVLFPDSGTYAAAAYHDENGNTKLDRNWIGFPVEAFGVSNNPPMFLIPPSHEEAAFEVDSGVRTIDIRLKY